jgi:hypothetical protein
MPRAPLHTLFVISVCIGSGAHADPFRCLAAAYPEWVKQRRVDPSTGQKVVDLRDWVQLTWDDGIAKTAEERLEHPDLEDMFVTAYPAGATDKAPPPNVDPGRVRVTALFDSLYGKSEREVAASLEEVVWLPHLAATRLRFNGRQGAAAALRRASSDLEKLPAPLRKYFKVTAGTYNRRPIAGTDRPSAHSWGIAIDIDTQQADYWRWNISPSGAFPYKNRIPLEIVRVFERHGFIWGGRWNHYDTMHFEYRPELLRPECIERREIKEAAQ